MSDLLVAERNRLHLYRSLDELKHWREHQLSDLAAPFPNYTSWIHLSRLGLFDAWLAAREGRTAEAQSALNDDARFWRFVLTEAEYIVTKLIAATALQQNIQWTNSLSREFGVPLPLVWESPISEKERSLLEVFTGEYQFSRAAIHELMQDPGDGFFPHILMPFHKVQATENMQAERLLAAANVMKAPFTDLPDRLATHQKSMNPARKWSWYNATGHWLSNVYAVDFTQYGTRVADLEGFRRVLLATLHLRQAGVSPEDVAQHLAEHDLKNPYTGKPLLWDSDSNAIGVKSLRHPRQDISPYPINFEI
ncbi:hypothetical protein [Marinimicrobium sp. ABcell2]|uniref:hypothetical protein n=1 Tax=Marinimicrobium sp. ABcell2 TaxID=3069751 RepID=UPI0027AF8BE4|nr:hypothetical protein [Marinimicrobium sp. ABcell2]MDQ2075158.1 hypothetical protein [Marinimicrobium sp. ABcell2]